MDRNWPQGGGEAGRLMRDVEWAATPLGRLADWRQDRKAAVEIVLQLPTPACLLWGRALTQIYNDAYGRLLGDGDPDAFGRPATALPLARALYEAVLDTGTPMSGKAFLPVMQSGGRRNVSFAVTLGPVHGEDGTVGAVLCTAVETGAAAGAPSEPKRKDASRRPAEAVQPDEARLHALAGGSPQLAWRASDGGRWTWSSPQWTAFTGLPPADSLDLGWLDALHPADRDGALRAWAAARPASPFETEARLWDAAAGQHRWFHMRATAIAGSGPRVVEWLGTSSDIHELRTLRDQSRELTAELQHRVRNTLSVMRSIARRTAHGVDSIEDYVMYLDGRLGALGRAELALTRQPTRGIDLHELIAEEMLTHAAHEGEEFEMSGPPVRFQAKAGELFTLAFHELATNSVKYGALSAERGRIRIDWSLETDSPDRFVLVWREAGLRTEPVRHRLNGFGADLMDRTLAYELMAETSASFDKGETRWTIAVPHDPKFFLEPQPDPERWAKNAASGSGAG